ncbi:PDC sensor domain-containing protein [Litorilituus lipolyticus]|uniref:General glycosylation pathway protein n=1 Tax=Litorilituus lipolyticus TaxID=2491017 RepID=A0A502L5Y8_9GAMM|nr:PDC sensor domain-containing protein [Litorilituus lipolyticus]TPH18544.1 general glycosylation pathway protein [Litorilituus lipolyticus]
MNYINVMERYHEYKDAIHELMASIIAGAFDKNFFDDEHLLDHSMKWLSTHYPFVELIFTLDQHGIQKSQNYTKTQVKKYSTSKGKGADRSFRPYYIKASEHESIVVTEPYLSSSSHNLCISTAIKYTDKAGVNIGILVIDIDLAHAIEFLMGDIKRKKFHPLFSFIYTSIVIGLFFIVAILLFSAGSEIVSLMISPSSEDLKLKPFGIIIFLTLALAIFDLGKTTIEEEVLMQKDILRHSSTRRTITRFIATILIAVSIEALLLMFKSVLGSSEYLVNAVAMMAASVGLLIGLGIYVYLGAKAEVLLKYRSTNE